MRTLFKYLIGFSALFIAGCAAFFSVKGLGLLFAGSAVSVMVMAASLELGKLMAASFLYRYWRQINVPLRIYLSAAVLVLIGITSLGIYGYLARAYEQTQSTIALLEQQILTTEKQNSDTQRQIDQHLADASRLGEGERQDLDSQQQRLDDLNQRLGESLARLEERRASARRKRDEDVALLRQRLEAIDQVFRQNTTTEEQLITEYAGRLEALDRAVDAYTREGGGGFLKQDKIKLGQQLRDQQKPERDAIAQAIAGRHQAIESLRQQREKDAQDLAGRIDAVDEDYDAQLSRLAAQERVLRDEHAAGVTAAETRLAELRGATRSTAGERDDRVKGLYQRLQAGHAEIARLRAEIAATDIGSYRFVARAMNAPVDDVVKWLILIVVLVFDPLAVALTVGFNIAMLGNRPTDAGAPRAGRGESPPRAEAAGAAPLPSWATLATVVVVVGVLLAIGGYGATHYMSQRRERRHAAMIPDEAFAVLALDRGGTHDPMASLQRLVSPQFAAQMSELLAEGFDPAADLYVFLTFPQSPATEQASAPVILLGMVAAVTDAAAAERSLSRFAETAAGSLLPGRRAGVDRSRAMIRLGSGRYLDPEGGFFTFALTDGAAMMLLELEGDPRRPLVEQAVRQALLGGSPQQLGRAAERLPAVATQGDAALSLWFDGRRCFANMPKNAQAQTRYEQLQRFLDFDLTLFAEPTDKHALKVAGHYTYGQDRFDVADAQGAIDSLTALGPATMAGMPGLLMDRCADTLDFEALIARLRQSLSADGGVGPAEIVVDQVIESQRSARFVLKAQFSDEVDSPLAVTLERLAPKQ